MIPIVRLTGLRIARSFFSTTNRRYYDVSP